MKTAVSQQEQKSAYQIKREKAGARCGMLSFLLLILILATNIDNVMAAEQSKMKITGFGFDLNNVEQQMSGSNASVEFVSLKQQSLQNLKALRGSDIIVQEGIDDFGIFLEMMNEVDDAIVVVVGDSLLGQGLMLDNLIITHTFAATDTLVAILKMKLINPRLKHAQLVHGLFGENELDQIALERKGEVASVDVEYAKTYATESLKLDTEAPRFVAATPRNAKTFKARYEDNNGVSYVEMFVDDKFVSRDFEAPFEFDIDAYANQRVSLIAYDSAANFSRMDIK